jgi:uncharacterized protein (TIGR02300 family)
MPKNPNLGNRFTCFRCGTKFYDLNSDPSLCPDCGADQADAPSLNPAKRLRSRSTAPRKDEEKKAAEEDEEEESEAEDKAGVSPLEVLDSAEAAGEEED